MKHSFLGTLELLGQRRRGLLDLDSGVCARYVWCEAVAIPQIWNIRLRVGQLGLYGGFQQEDFNVKVTASSTKVFVDQHTSIIALHSSSATLLSRQNETDDAGSIVLGS